MCTYDHNRCHDQINIKSIKFRINKIINHISNKANIRLVNKLNGNIH